MSHNSQTFCRTVRDRGFRVTPQRQLILDAVCEGEKHTTPEEIFERVRARAPAVNRATVYRNLDFLCEMQLVVAVQIGQRMYYEITGARPHHHLICRRCGRQEQFDQKVIQPLINQLERERGFRVDMDHLALFGLCPACRGREEKKK